jgi:hypothetical protein
MFNACLSLRQRLLAEEAQPSLDKHQTVNWFRWHKLLTFELTGWRGFIAPVRVE